jgi:hypothetical protein
VLRYNCHPLFSSFVLAARIKFVQSRRDTQPPDLLEMMVTAFFNRPAAD